MSRVVVERDRRVEMADGVSLATDVYRPDDDAEHPVLVHRNPYDKSNAKSVGGLIFNPLDAVEAGFVVVVQDVRGRFESGGDWEPFRHERADGYRTVEWAARQPWSDGHVGIYGASYHGATALQAAVASPPHLDAVFAYSTGCNYHQGFVYEGGAFNLGFCLYWTLGLTGDEERTVADDNVLDALDDARANPREYVARRPTSSILPTRGVAEYWREWLDHPDYDDYWRAVDVGPDVADVDCPVLHLSGWYDVFLQGHLDLAERLRGADVDSQFVVGPWDHEAYTTLTPSKVGDRVFGPEAATGTGLMRDLALDWFERLLTDDPDTDPGQSVRYFQMGREEWRETDEWPPDHERRPLYFAGGDGDTEHAHTGTLSRSEPETGRPPDSYRYEPSNPVPTNGGRIHQPLLGPAGRQDQSSIVARSDVLCYVTPALTDAVDVAGPVECRLHVACSQPDTDFVVKLLDVDPSGYHGNVADGVLRARYRHSKAEPTYFEPGSTYEVAVDVGAVAHTFDEGHRIGVAVTSSDFPRFDRNPNTRGPVATTPPEGYEPVDVRVFHDASRPSRLLLPETTR